MSNGGIGIPVLSSAAIYKSSLKVEMMEQWWNNYLYILLESGK